MDTRYLLPPSTAADLGSAIYRRLDEVEMSSADRERAKSYMRAADETATWIVAAFAQVRALFGAPRAAAHAR